MKADVLPVQEAPPDNRLLISELCTFLESYMTQEQMREVYRAYLFGAEAHETQKRISGEPYIYHPIAVARILAGMHMDQACLMAALLHDVLEDTGTSREELASLFGEEVANLVDGVSKLTQMRFKSKAEAQAASFRKMMLAVAKDIRIILIKLADRLHNMRTLTGMRPDKRRRIAQETLEIYAPIANRFGINGMRQELERLSFANRWPMRYRVITEHLRRTYGNRKDLVARIEEALRQRLNEAGIESEAYGREKNSYSIYCKMRDKHLALHELADVFAFRIIVDKVDTCYRVLGVVHNLYKPKPGTFQDYIAIPKANGYQSLHTTIMGPSGMPIEIQIRTRDMHQLAECGIAAHWAYKSKGQGARTMSRSTAEWLAGLLEMPSGAGDSMEFLENVKIDLFPDEVYVFTPRGDIKVLPRGATIIDFAYAVHSDVGNRCVAAQVDKRMAPLRTRLHNGQTVKIITQEDGVPNSAWLNFVVTSKARSHIRTYLKNIQEQEATSLGRRLLDRELMGYGRHLDDIDPEVVKRVLGQLNIASLDALLSDIALGNRMPRLVAHRLTGRLDAMLVDENPEQSLTHDPLVITGTEGMVINYARCCRPIPGDAISAIFNPGKGMVVHRQECPNVQDRKIRARLLELSWAEDIDAKFTSEIRVAVGNQPGVLATVAAAIADMGANIENVTLEERDGVTSTLCFVIEVRNRQHLADIMRSIRSTASVIRIVRSLG